MKKEWLAEQTDFHNPKTQSCAFVAVNSSKKLRKQSSRKQNFTCDHTLTDLNALLVSNLATNKRKHALIHSKAPKFASLCDDREANVSVEIPKQPVFSKHAALKPSSIKQLMTDLKSGEKALALTKADPSHRISGQS